VRTDGYTDTLTDANRCGEIYDMDFVVNFMKNTTVKKNLKIDQRL